MSKKEQKLKKNLYKALTEYFIHNTKNSLASSESILDQLASFRMETGLPAALRQDKKYQKAQKNCNKANEKMQDLNLICNDFCQVQINRNHHKLYLVVSEGTRKEPRSTSSRPWPL